MNKNVTFLFNFKNIWCVQFSSCHTMQQQKVFNVKFFPNYGRNESGGVVGAIPYESIGCYIYKTQE